jgi:hypothetical protein
MSFMQAKSQAAAELMQ